MATEKKGFVLYADQKELFEHLPNEKAGELIKHIFKYVNDENPITEDLIIKLAFTSIKQNLKRDLKKWEDKKENKSLSGQEGNLKRWHPDIYKDYKDGKQTLKESQSIAKGRTAIKPIANIAVNVNDNVTVKVKDKVKVKEIIKDKRKEELFREWLIYRKQINKEIKAEITIKGLASKFNRESLAVIKFVVENSINNSWTGLFWDKAEHIKSLVDPTTETMEERITRLNNEHKQQG